MKRPLAAVICLVLGSLFATTLGGQQASLPGTVTGSVICGDTSRPCRFASVLLQAVRESPSAKTSSYSTTSGLDGNFQLNGVQPGTYYVTGQLPGYLSLSAIVSKEELKTGSAAVQARLKEMLQTVVVEPSQATTISLHLERGATISGTIRYDDGSPAVNLQVTFYKRQKDGSWHYAFAPTPGIMGALGMITTDDTGHYRETGLPAGEYTVETHLPEFRIGLEGFKNSGVEAVDARGEALKIFFGDVFQLRKATAITLSAGDEHVSDITIPTGGLHSIRGFVTARRDGHALSSGEVLLLDGDDKSTLRTTSIAKDGSYVFNNVAGGSYLIRTSAGADPQNETAKRNYGTAELPISVESDADNTNLAVPDKAVR